MRNEIINRITSFKKIHTDESLKWEDADVYERMRKKRTKRVRKELNKHAKDMNNQETFLNSQKSDLLNLYVLSENIPRVSGLDTQAKFRIF